MRKVLTIALCCALGLSVAAQTKKAKPRKYPSLLWEITGNGLKKPSYLFGTMHVSNKMAFHLSDSFYIGIRNADVVALETNPETWQQDMAKYDFENALVRSTSRGGFNRSAPDDYLTSNTLRFSPYEKLMEQALYSNPSMINNLLYRNYSSRESDFEEDTYLDMHLFQAGKKWGKKVQGVEDFGESMRLMMEAYADGMNDKNRRERSYDLDAEFLPNKLQDAYRTGDLDLLDTINQLNSNSPAFDEKFLYRRNEIQAASIRTIIRSGASLFVGVGAAHLPGKRGVIEMLRQSGYRLRPIKMTERASHFKEEIEKLRVPVTFQAYTAPDGFFKVAVPGVLQRTSGEMDGLDQQQFADMANGSYYMVSRVQTNALLWGKDAAGVLRQIDSVLYENIPGKIITKKRITQNGYQGFDVVNKIRRGDFQRYRIFVTPFEVLVFKMSGNEDYVTTGTEAEQFFGSIQLQAMKEGWKKFMPAAGGFEVLLPHAPLVTRHRDWRYVAASQGGDLFKVIRTDIHNYEFAEEDTFDLNLMEESFAGSPFIQRQLARRQHVYRGYPALDVTYRHKDSSVSLVRFLIRGPHYYTLIAHGKSEKEQMKEFLNSFAIRPYQYGPGQQQTDPAMHYTVAAPMVPDEKEVLIASFRQLFQQRENNDDDTLIEKGVYRDRLVANDTTGEKVYVSFYQAPHYFYDKDSSIISFITREKDWIVRSRKAYELPSKMKVWEYEVSDTGSSRTIRTKVFYRNGVGYSLTTQGDTLTAPSSFVARFFETFTPSDSVQGIDPFTPKSPRFFADFFSSDTTLHKKAIKNLGMMQFDSADAPALIRAIASLSWKEKGYLDIKKSMIRKLGSLPGQNATRYLKTLYLAAGDTLDLQYAVLEGLLEQRTAFAYAAFRDIVVNEPPVLNIKAASFYNANASGNKGYDLFESLADSLSLAATVAKDMLPLINLDDYKFPVLDFMGSLVDSNFLSARDYSAYLPKLLLEAKQELKKQAIIEKSRAIEKAQENNDADTRVVVDADGDDGNSILSLYATLLMPFWDSNPAVPPFIHQLLKSSDMRLKYNTARLLVRHEKPLPDTLLQHLAANDQFRYELFTDLKALGSLHLYPKAEDRIALAKSKLVYMVEYEQPDTIAYVGQLPARMQQRNGSVYIFKYKDNKDDNSWKLATVGLVPAGGKEVEWDDDNAGTYDLTELTDIKLDEEEPLDAQLQKVLRQQLYGKRKSARKFYAYENRNTMYNLED